MEGLCKARPGGRTSRPDSASFCAFISLAQLPKDLPACILLCVSRLPSGTLLPTDYGPGLGQVSLLIASAYFYAVIPSSMKSEAQPQWKIPLLSSFFCLYFLFIGLIFAFAISLYPREILPPLEVNQMY